MESPETEEVVDTLAKHLGEVSWDILCNTVLDECYLFEAKSTGSTLLAGRKGRVLVLGESNGEEVALIVLANEWSARMLLRVARDLYELLGALPPREFSSFLSATVAGSKHTSVERRSIVFHVYEVPR